MKADESVVLFDGVCNLCRASVGFIIRRDRSARYHFASLQSEAARNLLANNGGVPSAIDTIILLEAGNRYDRSTAALRIARHLDGAWPLFYAFIIVPRFLRDPLYNWIARNRYRWFGRQDQCLVPGPDWNSRFI